MLAKDKKRQTASLPSQQEILRAIVESSDDAILTKNLDGAITSWNKGAEKLFGYSAAEVMGRPNTMLMPPDRLHEEADIMARIRAGERVRHFETVRMHRDGHPIHISLTISPLHDSAGQVIGASKIARDISDLHRAQEMQRVLIGEMQHRIKNVFSLAASLVSLSAGRADTPAEVAADVRKRLRALAAAHELTVPVLNGANLQLRHSTFSSTVQALLEPYLMEGDSTAITISGPELVLATKAITPVALLVNELITNAMKHGALRDGDGTIAITTAIVDDVVTISWEENHKHMQPEANMQESGFGSKLSRLAVEQQLNGTLLRIWREDGLVVVVSFALASIVDVN